MKTKPSQLRTVLTVMLVLCSLLLAGGPFSTRALAHNQLLKTQPTAHVTLKTAPTYVEFWFAEKPDMTVTKIAIKGPSGAVEIGAVHAMAGNTVMADFKGQLAAGEYTVSWQTAGDDGHISKGEFDFNVSVQ